jgi:transcriptional regulator of NAD metabolism
MTSEERRQEILRILESSDEPITGAELARKFCVTRQIIVKDIALIKAEGVQVLSTAKGYFVQKKMELFKRRTITVCHSADAITDELQIIVDLGGRVLDTQVDHPFYGRLGEVLNIKSRKDIGLFLNKLHETGCEPLLYLTKGVHMHTIEAEDEKSLDEICHALDAAGYLLLE